MMDTALTEAPQPANPVEPELAGRPSGGGQPVLTPEAPQSEPRKGPESARDSLTAEAKKIGDEPKAEEPPAKDEKAADEPAKAEGSEKPAKADDRADPKKTADSDAEAEASDDDQPAPPQPKGREQRKVIEAPAKFLPRAKEQWANVPHPVREEVARTLREHEEEVTRYREAGERYEAVREFDELARQNGGDLRRSLERVHALETMVAQNPIRAMNEILMQAGPRKPDGSPLTMFEVANYIAQQGPEGYNQLMQQGAPQQQTAQPQANAEVESLKQQVEAMRAEMAAKEVIEPFAREHPRFAELQEDIAFFLQSGRIPNSLSPADRLAAAYDMAERINPASNVEYAEPTSRRTAPDDDSRAGTFGGSKSIKSTPGGRIPEDEPQPAKSTREALDMELRRMRRA